MKIKASNRFTITMMAFLASVAVTSRAAGQGNAGAQFNLGNMYANGQGVA